MQILRGLVDDQGFQVLDCLNIFNIGIEQFALFVQVIGLLLERGLNAAAAQALADKLTRLLVVYPTMLRYLDYLKTGANCSRSGRSRVERRPNFSKKALVVP